MMIMISYQYNHNHDHVHDHDVDCDHDNHDHHQLTLHKDLGTFQSSMSCSFLKSNQLQWQANSIDYDDKQILIIMIMKSKL